ncbi:hypothetical protein SUDANB121_02996 [Nocardiopsis dassonvillei]|uniref:hypothetical protein n=1 Tax=Nocardiopsis dassonvillei TaxID=2014 RepID=UPI003F5523B7
MTTTPPRPSTPYVAPLCGESHLDQACARRECLLEEGHTGPHEDVKGRTWEPPERTLERLRSAWGRTHRIAWTGSLWMATHRDPDAPWRTEVEPTPEQLEERLRAHSTP